MIQLNLSKKNLEISVTKETWGALKKYLIARALLFTIIALSVISVISAVVFYFNSLGLAYNDSRSHLDIGRRVVEGLKPGIAQLGSVWLPLPHILLIPTIWNDFMWHSGLSGIIFSMASYIATGVLIYLFLKELNVGPIGRIMGVAVFALNLNILYLQSTPMTEALLLTTMTAGVYELLLWYKRDKILHIIRSSFWTMLATLIRYDGWFLLIVTIVLVAVGILKRYGFKRQMMEGKVILFSTLGGLGIFLWLLWNLIIFKDPFYFIFGPYSAYTQQTVLQGAGNLATKGDLLLSLKYYLFALSYNSGALVAALGFLGAILFWLEKRISLNVKIATSALLAPLVFNILALYLGHSVLYVQGLSGNTWFNIRYGVMMVPSLAIFIGFLIDRFRQFKVPLISFLLLIILLSIASGDAVTIDDAREGASQKNVSEISRWLKENTADKEGFILISAASHDAIIFSSGLPMKRFIHEGTGEYWKSAVNNPRHWARWIIMRTYDPSDATYEKVAPSPDFNAYELVGKYPFADIYQLKSEYLSELNTKEVFAKQK